MIKDIQSTLSVLLYSGLALLENVEIVLTSLDVVAVELEAINKIGIFHLTDGLVGLCGLLGVNIGLGLALCSFVAMTVSPHNASHGLVSDFTTSTESHTLEYST